MKKNYLIIIIVLVIAIVFAFFIFRDRRPKRVEVRMPKHSIKKVGTSECGISYEKICFKIPDDYKCVGKDKCQLSNEKDMLLLQVSISEKYKNDLSTYLKSGRNSTLIDQEEKELNGEAWMTAKSKYRDERYYFIKIDNDIYTVKILSLRDSGGKFDELIKTVEENLKVKK